jgi:hypothetical protein
MRGSILLQHARYLATQSTVMATEERSSRASFNHSCIKTPLDPISGMPSPGYERRTALIGPTSLPSRPSCRASRASSASGPRSRASSAQQRPSSSTRYIHLSKTYRHMAIIL